MTPPFLYPANNIAIANAFASIHVKVMAAHTKQFNQEYVEGCSDQLRTLDAYHIAMLYGMLIQEYVTNEIYEPNDLAYWKEATNYSAIKTCLKTMGVDLDSIFSYLFPT